MVHDHTSSDASHWKFLFELGPGVLFAGDQRITLLAVQIGHEGPIELPSELQYLGEVLRLAGPREVLSVQESSTALFRLDSSKRSSDVDDRGRNIFGTPADRTR